MYNEVLRQEMIDSLEQNGEIRITDGIREVYIQSFDDEGPTVYVSNTNKEFDDVNEAIDWSINYFGGLENIEEWE